MNPRIWLIASLAFVLIAGGAVTAALLDQDEASGDDAAVAPAFHARYSPFVVQVEGSAHFDTISFKDAGIADVSNDRSIALYELVAESVSLELGQSEELRLHSAVAYDEAMADPANHTACAGRHIYVDIWHATDRDTWGYSLWSGCGEEDNFAWREVNMSSMDDESAEVDALAVQIRRDLGEAIRTGCFTRAC